jgi:hypothetical protein
MIGTVHICHRNLAMFQHNWLLPDEAGYHETQAPTNPIPCSQRNLLAVIGSLQNPIWQRFACVSWFDSFDLQTSQALVVTPGISKLLVAATPPSSPSLVSGESPASPPKRNSDFGDDPSSPARAWIIHQGNQPLMVYRKTGTRGLNKPSPSWGLMIQLLEGLIVCIYIYIIITYLNMHIWSCKEKYVGERGVGQVF